MNLFGSASQVRAVQVRVCLDPARSQRNVQLLQQIVFNLAALFGQFQQQLQQAGAAGTERGLGPFLDTADAMFGQVRTSVPIMRGIAQDTLSLFPIQSLPLIPGMFGCNAALAFSQLTQMIADLDLLTQQVSQMEASYRPDANRIRHNILQPPPSTPTTGLRVPTTAERIALGTVQFVLMRLLQILQEVRTALAAT